MSKFRHIDIFPLGITCKNCEALLGARNSAEDLISNCLLDRVVNCRRCSNRIDIWRSIRNMISDNFLKIDIFSLIGAKLTSGQIDLDHFSGYELKFEDIGIPKGAKILSINYTSGGKAWPVQAHSNVPSWSIPQEKVIILPYLRDKEIEEEKTTVTTAVTWIDKHHLHSYLDPLSSAMNHFVSGKYLEVIIPVNVAMEIEISSFLAEYLRIFASKENVENFLIGAATYSHQLKILMPLAAKNLGVKELSPHIRGQLNLLRDFRNDIAHRGEPRRTLDRKVTGELICAVLFGVTYVSLLKEAMKEALGND